jgi:glycosyltransferase involved in cell wall biosynthesis
MSAVFLEPVEPVTSPKTEQKRVIARYSRMPHYQAYYWLALSLAGRLSVRESPWWYKVLPAIPALDVDGLLELLRPRFGLEQCWHSPDLSDFTGCYTLRHRGKTIKFAIDGHDLKDIVAPKALAWADVYFKANMWGSEEYPAKVAPIVNGNGFLRSRHLAKLRKLRRTARDNDVIFISRIWGGVEHNVRLFEELAALPGKKRLVAIFVAGTASSDETELARKRLERVGVECTSDLLSIEQLWQEMAASRIVILRAGKHLCIPWRMIDLLCMGACIVSDADFYPQWPERLAAGEQYVSAGVDRPADTSSASVVEFGKLGETVARLLEDEKEQKRLRQNSAAYFDNHASPERVGDYILSRITRL